MIFSVNFLIFALWMIAFVFAPPIIIHWAGILALAYVSTKTFVGEHIVNWIRRKSDEHVQ